jgi:hypothetical protein
MLARFSKLSYRRAFLERRARAVFVFLFLEDLRADLRDLFLAIYSPCWPVGVTFTPSA